MPVAADRVAANAPRQAGFRCHGHTRGIQLHVILQIGVNPCPKTESLPLVGNDTPAYLSLIATVTCLVSP